MTTLVRWEPFRELGTLHSEMSRLMNGVLEGNGRTAQNWVPSLDVWETPTEVVYAFDLPGIPEDEISIEVNDETLTISAERAKTEETNEDGFYRFERRYGTFARAVGLPQGVSSISAERAKTEETNEDGFYRFERRYGTFARAVGLPQGVDQDSISARYENGVLEVRVPKPEEPKPKKIALSKTVGA